MVFQHFSLFESLTVAENVALALDGTQSVAEVAGRLAQVSRDYGLPLDPARRVDALSVGERQRIEIVRCLMQDPRLLILDEPTAVLTPQEAEQLFATLRRLAGEGRGILYITHRLEEVRRFCHRATILRHGKLAGLCDPRHETAASLARMMIGGDPGALQQGGGAAAGADGRVLLAANGLACDAADIRGVALHDVRLALRGGEILAIAGVAGNGQAELFALLSGERLAERAEFVPEERLGHAAAPGMTLSENAALTGQGGSRPSAAWRFDRRAALAVVDAIVARFDVRKGRRDPEAGSLSGGNLQKFVVGREILRAPCVLVVNQPTWGVDAGAAATIRQALLDLARGGSAVLVISQDLDEVFQIADRVAVIHDGCLSQPRPAAEMTAERLGLLMGGASGALAQA
jgi:simple sugar transport system ATP-binding protein